jgi:two-component system LytT family response regulator
MQLAHLLGMTSASEARIYPSRLEIRSVRHVLYVETQEIDWIEAADNYVILHTTCGSHLMRESMTRLETRLDPEKFLRIHRSTIVNLNRVREIRSRRFGDRMAVLRDGTEVRVSRDRKFALERSLKQM